MDKKVCFNIQIKNFFENQTEPNERDFGMKKYFFIGVCVILFTSLVLVGYGAWLNISDENQIASRMDNRVLKVEGVRAAVMDITPSVKLDAVRFISDNMTDAIALTDGRIVKWNVEKNSHVKSGEIILSMTDEQLPLKIQQASSAVKRAEANLAQMNSAYQRQNRLMAKEATSEEKFEAAEAQFFAANETLHEAEAQLEQYLIQQSWLNVASPVDGEVLIVYQAEGAFVKAGMPVALVGDFDKLKFSTVLSDSDAVHMKTGDICLLTFPDRWSMGKAYDTEFGAGNQGWNQRVEARIVEIAPPPEERSAVRRIVFEVDNRTRLLEPMTYNGVEMQPASSVRCLAVPLSAMVDGSNDKVFVQDANGILHRVNVVTGASNDRYVEIVSGISAGDIVITSDSDGLEEGMKVNVVFEEE